jgi:hypothetical protein
MKRTLAIFAIKVCAASCLLGQMAGMATPSVVHHIVAYVREPGSNYFKDQLKEEFFVAPPARTGEKVATDDVPSDWLVGYAPGQPPDMFEPGQAKLIPAGSDIVLEVHYMAEGKATTDQANLGLVLAKETPAKRVMTLSTGNEKFKIPLGDPDYRVDASFTFRREVTLLGMHPHMHMRGKDISYRVVFPNGETRALLNVPHTILLDADGNVLYQADKPVDQLKLRRTILANLPSAYIGLNNYWLEK